MGNAYGRFDRPWQRQRYRCGNSAPLRCPVLRHRIKRVPGSFL